MGYCLGSVVTFNLGPAKVCSAAIYDTYIAYHKDIWIAVTDYYMHFYIIMLFPLTAIHQLICFYSFIYLFIHTQRYTLNIYTVTIV